VVSACRDVRQARQAADLAGLLFRAAAVAARRALAVAAALAAGTGCAAGAGAGRLAIAVAHAAGTACFFRSKFVCRSFCVGSLAALAGDLALACRIHRSETAIAGTAALAAAALIAALFATLIA